MAAWTRLSRLLEMEHEAGAELKTVLAGGVELRAQVIGFETE